MTNEIRIVDKEVADAIDLELNRQRGNIELIASENIVFTGDTLFCLSIGRTDFEGGSFPEICKSIQEKLFVLPEETICYPGHGEGTSIKHEKRRNPYVRS